MGESIESLKDKLDKLADEYLSLEILGEKDEELKDQIIKLNRKINDIGKKQARAVANPSSVERVNPRNVERVNPRSVERVNLNDILSFKQSLNDIPTYTD